RSSVERGEAQRVELQYQLTLSRRDAERVAELSRDKRSITEERGRREKEVRGDEFLFLISCGKEEDEQMCDFSLQLLEQRVKSLQLNIEAERAAHLETKFNSEIVQLRVRDLEAVVAAERSGQQEAQSTLELLRAQFREVENAYSQERERSGSTERVFEIFLVISVNWSFNPHVFCVQAVQRQCDTEEAFVACVKQIRDALQQHTSTGEHSMQPAEDDGKQSLSAKVLQLLRTTLSSDQQRLLDADKQAHLSFLYCLYQRLLAGCVLLDQSQSILGNFTWEELCDVMSEQVDQLTSDLRKANEKVCFVKDTQMNLPLFTCFINRPLCRSQCDSLRDHASSLEQRCSSLTSDLSQLRGLLSRSRKELSSFFLACALLGGALRHSQNCVRTLSEQKKLLSRQLAEREQLEEEVRRLVDALEGEKDEEKERERMRRVVRRWRKSVCIVLAVGRWWSLTRKTTVLFRLERGGGAPAVCVCGEEDAASQEGQDASGTLSPPLTRMETFSACSSPPLLISAASSGLSRLLDHLLDQSQSSLSSRSVHKETLIGRLRLGLSRLTTSPQPDMKSLVSILQQHFLVFSQRLHSAEVERRGLRLEVANLKRGLRKETRMVRQNTHTCAHTHTRFRSVCSELRQALSREQEAQVLIQEQCNQLHTLQRRVDTHTAEQAETQRTLSQTTQFRDSLIQSQHSLTAKPRPLLLPLENLELSGTESIMGAPEVAACQVTGEGWVFLSFFFLHTSFFPPCHSFLFPSFLIVLVPSFIPSFLPSSPFFPPFPPPFATLSSSLHVSLPVQSFLSIVSQLCHTCSSRIDWLEQEVSAHRSHVTALRSELQDACLRDNLAFVPVRLPLL
uniref:Coiled-coil domain containing 171 n=1 Tax=Amphilophus citrinellus TaxID=61819 RepID=A0A3Q0RRN9_AMPCI